MHTASHQFRFIDLFAGIGGFRFALEPLGGECVFTAEWDKFARRTYAAWHREDLDDPRFASDITQVAPEDVPAHDVLAAGFPCQPFSLAGVSKKGSLGRAHGFADPTQGTLFFDIKEILAVHRPAVAFLENVKHLLRHDKGQTWEVIQETLDEIDYEVHVDIVDARHWVPQHRERVLIVAIDRRRVPDIADEENRFTYPTPPDAAPVLAEILEAPEDVPDKYVLSPKLWKYLRDYRKKHAKAGNGFGFSKVGPEDVARTLSARYHKDGSEILVDRGPGRRPRRLMPIEAQRLMGFDHDSLGRPRDRDLGIVVSDTQAYRQFGNAVVPAVVNHVAAAALDHVARLRPRWADCLDAGPAGDDETSLDELAVHPGEALAGAGSH